MMMLEKGGWGRQKGGKGEKGKNISIGSKHKINDRGRARTCDPLRRRRPNQVVDTRQGDCKADALTTGPRNLLMLNRLLILLVASVVQGRESCIFDKDMTRPTQKGLKAFDWIIGFGGTGPITAIG